MDPKDCPHPTLRRIMDFWYCFDCGLRVHLEKHRKEVVAVTV